MDEFKKLLENKLVWVIFVLLGIFVGVLFINNYLVSRVTDKVIERLQRNYVPGPYAPGIDPDKVRLTSPISPATPNYPNRTIPSRTVPSNIPQVDPIPYNTEISEVDWEKDWEAQRFR
jgi:hypothetical protein